MCGYLEYETGLASSFREGWHLDKIWGFSVGYTVGLSFIGAEKRTFHFVNSFFVCWIRLLVCSETGFSVYMPRIYRSTLYKVRVGNQIKHSPTQLTTLHFFLLWSKNKRKLCCYLSSDIEKLNRILKLLVGSFVERAVCCSSLISKILERPNLLSMVPPNVVWVHWIPALMSTQQACDWSNLKTLSPLQR